MKKTSAKYLFVKDKPSESIYQSINQSDWVKYFFTILSIYFRSENIRNKSKCFLINIM